MGKVTVLPETTKDPISMMGRRAGICWGADITDEKKNYARGLDCIESNHGRVIEFPDVHMVFDGYSAKCLREYYTHIGCLPSRLQSSTRYIDYSKGDGFAYTTPHTIANNEKALGEWQNIMKTVNGLISRFINEYKIPVEDATMALPIAYSSKMVDKRNPRNLIDMSRNRMCSRAYWEFRELFNDIITALKEYSPEWATLIELEFMPKCEYLGFCPEKHSCGRKQKKNAKIRKPLC